MDITSVESRAAFRQKFVEKFVQQNLPPKSQKQNKISGMRDSPTTLKRSNTVPQKHLLLVI